MKYINGVVGRKENSQSRNLSNLIHYPSEVSGRTGDGYLFHE